MRFSFLSRITLTISLLFISSCLTLEYLKNNIKETYASLAILQTKSIITKVVNKVILESVSLQEEINNKLIVSVMRERKEKRI